MSKISVNLEEMDERRWKPVEVDTMVTLSEPAKPWRWNWRCRWVARVRDQVWILQSVTSLGKMANACGAADREKVTSSLSMAADQPAHWTTKNSADPLWPTTSENTVVTVVLARFQFLYPFCSGPSSSASRMRSLSTFFSGNYFFQWNGLSVCLFDRPPLLYINKPVLGHSNEFPLLMIFFITNKKPKDLNFIQIVVGVLDKSGTRIEIAGSQRSQRCPRISRVTPVRLNSQRSNVSQRQVVLSGD